MKQCKSMTGRATRPLFIGILLSAGFGFQLEAQSLDIALHLKSRSWTTVRDLEAFNGAPSKSRSAQTRHYIIQFDQFPDQEKLWTLEDRGATILGFIPENAVMVSISGPISLEGLNARWRGRLEIEDKSSRLLSAMTTVTGQPSDALPDCLRPPAEPRTVPRARLPGGGDARRTLRTITDGCPGRTPRDHCSDQVQCHLRRGKLPSSGRASGG